MDSVYVKKNEIFFCVYITQNTEQRWSREMNWKIHNWFLLLRFCFGFWSIGPEIYQREWNFLLFFRRQNVDGSMVGGVSSRLGWKFWKWWRDIFGELLFIQRRNYHFESAGYFSFSHALVVLPTRKKKKNWPRSIIITLNALSPYNRIKEVVYTFLNYL